MCKGIGIHCSYSIMFHPKTFPSFGWFTEKIFKNERLELPATVFSTAIFTAPHHPPYRRHERAVCPGARFQSNPDDIFLVEQMAELEIHPTFTRTRPFFCHRKLIGIRTANNTKNTENTKIIFVFSLFWDV